MSIDAKRKKSYVKMIGLFGNFFFVLGKWVYRFSGILFLCAVEHLLMMRDGF